MSREDPFTKDAMDDPERKVIYVGRPMWRQGLFWVGVLLVSIALLASGWSTHEANKASKKAAAVAKEQAQEAKDRAQELRDIICGVYVPIGNATISGKNSVLGATIVAATHKAAVQLDCPGVKP